MRAVHKLNEWWLQYEYKHTTLAALAIIAFVALLDSTVVASFLLFVEDFGFLGAFIAGVLSVSFFTAVPAVVLLIHIAPGYDPFALAIVAGAGAMIGDWLLLLFFEERVFHELRPLFRKLQLHKIITALRRKSTRWILLVAGAVVISTPLPDEVGIALLGLSRIKQAYVLGICFVLNTAGLLGVILTAQVVAGAIA